MKKNLKKVLLLVLCAALLVSVTVAGTVAYLTSSAEVKNTFTAGNVTITMDEAKVDLYGVEKEGTARVTENTYKLIPGHTYTKDPTIYVGDTSEDCYIFVKIENGLGDAATIHMNAGWTLVSGTSNVWVYGTDAVATVVPAKDKVTPFNKFTFGADKDPAGFATATNDSAKIIVTAYAIQKDTLTGKTPAEIWALFATP